MIHQLFGELFEGVEVEVRVRLAFEVSCELGVRKERADVIKRAEENVGC